MIVFDSSTLILLAKIELLDTFLENYDDEVIIPKKVYEESTVKDTFDAQLIKKRVEEEKIKIISIKNTEMKKKVIGDFKLGEGEAEAIVLALEKKAEAIALDDRLGINACKLLNLSFINAIAVLIRTYEKKLISKEKVFSLLDKISYYGRYSREIIEDAKNQLG